MTELFPPFVSSKLKLRRADQHAKEFAARFETFADSSPYNMYLQNLPDGSASFYFGMVSFIPPEVSMALGDAIHCMRTALDLLAIDAVALNGKSTKGVRFPFAENRQSLEEQISKANFKRASASARRLLFETMPYRNGNDLLRALHDLDIMDKHQIVLPIFPGVHFDSLRFQREGKLGEGGFFNCSFSVDAKIFLEDGLPERVQLEQPIFVAYFNSEAPDFVQRKPVIETLKSFSEMISGVIESFELLLTGSVRNVPSEAPVPPPSPFGRRPVALVKLRDGRFCTLAQYHAAAVRPR